MNRVARDDLRAYARRLRRRALIRQGCRCLYCQSPLTEATATADHLRPRARGGKTAPSNVVAACKGCNEAKGDKLPLEFVWARTPGRAA